MLPEKLLPVFWLNMLNSGYFVACDQNTPGELNPSISVKSRHPSWHLLTRQTKCVDLSENSALSIITSITQQLSQAIVGLHSLTITTTVVLTLSVGVAMLAAHHDNRSGKC